MRDRATGKPRVKKGGPAHPRHSPRNVEKWILRFFRVGQGGPLSAEMALSAVFGSETWPGKRRAAACKHYGFLAGTPSKGDWLTNAGRRLVITTDEAKKTRLRQNACMHAKVFRSISGRIGRSGNGRKPIGEVRQHALDLGIPDGLVDECISHCLDSLEYAGLARNGGEFVTLVQPAFDNLLDQVDDGQSQKSVAEEPLVSEQQEEASTMSEHEPTIELEPMGRASEHREDSAEPVSSPPDRPERAEITLSAEDFVMLASAIAALLPRPSAQPIEHPQPAPTPPPGGPIKNWFKVITFIFALLLSGVVGFFSGMMVIQGNVHEVSERVKQLETEKETVWKRTESDVDDSQKRLDDLERSVREADGKNRVDALQLELRLEKMLRQIILEMREPQLRRSAS